MAVFNEPTKWQTSLVNSGDANTIPQSTPAGTGEASFNDGFPLITQIPIGAGGIAPDRKDFNGLFKILGDWIFFAQNGGLPTYSEKFDYVAGRVVLYNDNIYKCIQANGVSSTVVTPNSGTEYWQRLDNFVRSVNGVNADAGGNVQLDGLVKSVNGVNADAGGNVQLDGLVKSVNGVNADAGGNVSMPFVPDYTSAIEGITFPYTAPLDGIISIIVGSNGENTYFTFTVDDVQVIGYDSLAVSDLSADSFIIPIKKGSVAKLIDTGGEISFNIKFIPYGE